MALVDPGNTPAPNEEQRANVMEPTGDNTPQNGGDKVGDNPEHSTPGTFYPGGAHVKRPPPAKVFFAPQKYGFFTNNKVEQRWRDDPEKDKKTHADDIIANVTEKFFPHKRPASEQPPPLPLAPSFMPPPPPGVVPPGVPPPPFMIPPPIPGKDAKRIRFNDEESDENELFAKLLYKKLRSISSKKRLEILHVSIMEMVRQAQEEDERERAASGLDQGGLNMTQSI